MEKKLLVTIKDIREYMILKKSIGWEITVNESANLSGLSYVHI
jgi:hypothetical protein